MHTNGAYTYVYVVYTMAYKDFLYATFQSTNHGSKQYSYLLHMIMYKQIWYKKNSYTALYFIHILVTFLFQI